MTITVEAVYANGTFQPWQPVALAEGTAVQLTVQTTAEDDDPLDAVIGIGDSGRTDGAENHDHYIYGTPKRLSP